jgi:hypothetical protein
MKTKPVFTVTGGPYSVNKRNMEAHRAIFILDKDWYEYEASLVCASCGIVVDEWDSLSETYNGMQRLTKKEATASFREIRKDIAKGGGPTDWFSRAAIINHTRHCNK